MATVGAQAVLSRDEILDLARAAHQAPSIHNTQPWVLTVQDDGLQIREDRGRALAGVDPLGRERTISCGAAVRNAEVAMAHLGRLPRTALLPAGPDSELLATVVAGPATPCPPATAELYSAIWERRSHRRVFLPHRAQDDVRRLLSTVEVGPGVGFVVVPPGRTDRFAGLLWEAARLQVADAAVRAELTTWIREGYVADGLPVRSLGTAPFPIDSLLVSGVVGTQEPPRRVVEDLMIGSIVVVVTEEDGRVDWLEAGRAVEGLLLAVTRARMVAAFLNQPAQQRAVRDRLATLLGSSGHPQAVLRIGRPLVTVPATPRRPLGEVLQG